MGKGSEVSFNVSKCFSALVKISPCSKLKNFKINRAILTIAIERKESDNDENIPRKYLSPKIIIQRSVWDWYLAVVLNFNGLTFSSFSIYIFPDIKRNGI